METERSREKKRTTATPGRLSHTNKTREQTKPLHLSHNNPKRSPHPSGNNNMDPVEGSKKDRFKDPRRCSSYDDDNDDGDRADDENNEDDAMGNVRSHCGDDDDSIRPPSNIINPSKKRIKQNEKMNPLDMVSQVPRKLRSSINKALPAGRRNHCGHNENSIVRMSKKTVATDFLTRDEREVIEILSEFTTLAFIIKYGVDRKLSDENSDAKATESIAVSREAERNIVEDVKSPIKPTGAESITTSSTSECLEEAKRSKHLSGKDVSLRCTTIMDKAKVLQSKLNCAAKAEPKRGLALAGSLPDHVPSNGNSQITKPEVPPPKPDSGFSTEHCDSDPTTMQESKLSKEKIHNTGCREGATSNTRSSMVPTENRGAHGNQAEYTVASTENRAAQGSPFSTIKPMVGSSRRRGYWNNCSTHVRISHFIRDCKNPEKKNQPFPYQFKLKDGKGLVFATGLKSSERNNGIINPSCDDVYNRASDNTNKGNSRLQPEPKPKPIFDFMKLSTLREPGNPGKKMDSSAQLHVPYLQTTIAAPHHHMIPFSLPPVHYPPPYTEQIPFLGVHVAGGSSIQQQQKQQQMWKAHMAGFRYRPPVPMGQHTSLTIDNRGRGGTHRPINSNTQQNLVVPNPAANTVMMQHRQQNEQNQNHPRSFNEAGVLRPAGSPQLQVLHCSAQRM